MQNNKGEVIKFTCDGIVEATPDFIMYNVHEKDGNHRYVEHYNLYHLIKHEEYEATIGNLIPAAFGRSCYLVESRIVKSLTDDHIKDRTMYKIVRKLF